MFVCVNKTVLSNECDDTPPLGIDTIPCNPVQSDSIRDVSEPFQGP